MADAPPVQTALEALHKRLSAVRENKKRKQEHEEEAQDAWEQEALQGEPKRTKKEGKNMKKEQRHEDHLLAVGGMDFMVEVPKQYIAKVIGAGGAMVASIAKQSGAVINARDQSTDPCQVRVTGSVEAVEAAQRLILNLVEVASSRFSQGTVLDVPLANIGKVIGLRGVEIHNIQMKTGAKVDVDKSCDPCQVRLTGDPERIAMAEKYIRTLLMAEADDQSEYVEFPRSMAGAILGVRGARLKEIQVQSGARIDLDKSQPNVCWVRIAGTAKEIERAKQLVIQATKANAWDGPMAELPMTETLDLPDGCTWDVLDKAEALQSQHGVRIAVDCETNKVEINGKPQAVQAAMEAVRAVANMEASKPILRPAAKKSAGALQEKMQAHALKVLQSIKPATSVVKAESSGEGAPLLWTQGQADALNADGSNCCAFGTLCKKPMCRFDHPSGRQIDQNPSLSQCRFGTACTRADCFYVHPERRAIDEHLQEHFVLYLDEVPMPNRPQVLPTARDCEVFFDPFPFEVGSKDLDELLKTFGEIIRVDQIITFKSQGGKQKGFVKFWKHPAALACLQGCDPHATWSESERVITGEKFDKGRARCAYHCSLVKHLLGSSGEQWNSCLEQLTEGSGVSALHFDTTRARFTGKATQVSLDCLRVLVEDRLLTAHNAIREHIEQMPKSRKVLAWNLPDLAMSQEDLVECIFAPCGEIESWVFTKENAAEVVYCDSATAEGAAAKLNGMEMAANEVIQCTLAEAGDDVVSPPPPPQARKGKSKGKKGERPPPPPPPARFDECPLTPENDTDDEGPSSWKPAYPPRSNPYVGGSTPGGRTGPPRPSARPSAAQRRGAEDEDPNPKRAGRPKRAVFRG